MANSNSDRRRDKSIEEQKRERAQRARDERAEASREYLADIAINGSGCDGD